MLIDGSQVLVVVGVCAGLQRELIESGGGVKKGERVEHLSHQRISWLDPSQGRGDCSLAVGL